MTVTIYTLECPTTGHVKYVGATKRLRRRYNCHVSDPRSCDKTEWIRQLKLDGKRPIVGVLEVVESSNENDWQEAECFWIDTLRYYGCQLLNRYTGGNKGRRSCFETRQKMSLARKGKPFSATHKANLGSANRARVLPPEVIARMSALRKGIPRSAETKAKLSKAHKGKTLSVEHRRKIGLAGTGRRHSPETLEKMRILALAREKHKRETKHQ